jgi:two-component system, cell cycle sensor histidine kinase and response regulator CckA
MPLGRHISGLVRRLFEGVGLPIVVADPKRRDIAYVNTAFEDLSSHTLDQVRGTEVVKLFAKGSQDRIGALFEIAAGTTVTRLEEYDCEMVRKSGRRIPVHMIASQVVLAGRRLLIFSLHDLSYIRKLQNQREIDLRELGQISKLADIGMLAAGVAHELNNPLMIVQGFAENLDMLLDQNEYNRHELKSQTAEILRATDRISRIINQMTRMVRNTDIKFEIVDLAELANNVMRFLNHELKYSNATVTTDFGTANLIKCDHNQVEQVIMNIVSNAVHALEGRPEGREIRFSCVQEEKWVLLKIWNNGPAIPKEIQDKIMTPFFTTKDVGKGTGLGLAVSFGIMKAHDGSLSFASDERGTEFCLRFPAPQIQPVETRSHGGRTILLVDDDPAALDVLANKIRQFGYEVMKVRSGLEAFRIIADKPAIAAVFTDIRMNDMDGLALCRHIRQILNPGPAIYAVTGYIVTAELERDLRIAGVSGLLTKPINHNAFSAVMHEITAGKIPAA